MIRRKVFTGLGLGILCNVLGMAVLIATLAVVNGATFSSTITFFMANKLLWMMISLGALPNLLLFFWLLKKNKDYYARGVVMATLLAAILAFVTYFEIV